ncbi:toll/interleukin-1 receptor domain-containing protein [Cupriavidus sp. KK10]|uniref:toll/interleukin-1 receptor domain-containing protein n=1 Tax=Cupriavidus sp. KK10 TaxID=1478019 RepID=UPI001BAC0BDA|nr:toll/interleukin-1 receptor domain-containing protein [Cupriavidus sp. KK10]QUN27214.1 toll/interleukin-1 receptor domain-containing protein [Cupriavidus sp. KK10]
MPISTRPFLVVYVAWHPAFEEGTAIAKRLYDHYRRQLYENVAGGTGLSVLYRSAPDPSTSAPMAIDLDEGETAAIIVLFDEHLAADAAYLGWVKDLAVRTETAGLRARIFPVAIDGALVRTGVMEQAVRWDKWGGLDAEQRLHRLTSDLTYQFCRMLRSYLEQLRRPDENEGALEKYLRKVQIFLSHSKRDNDGERIAQLVRQKLVDGGGLASFFDVKDIPPGIPFDRVILSQVRVSAVVAIYTDSFSSREWCRREIIEAKRWSVPLVVANCISDTDERGFPYLGNVPVVRMDPAKVDRVDQVIARLLDEVLKDFLWRCKVKVVSDCLTENAVFLPRPPELISLAVLGEHRSENTTLVYPDPPLGSEEQRLFETIAPGIRLRTMTEWTAQSGVLE